MATRFAIHALFTDDANLIVILVARLLPQIIFLLEQKRLSRSKTSRCAS